MSVLASPVTARCVHCLWKSDHDPGTELEEIRSIHELIHPGGTVLVGPKPEPTHPGQFDASGFSTSDEEPKPEAPANGKWTREASIEAIKAWAAANGAPPTTTEWLKRGDTHPDRNQVAWLFGNFGNAIVEAGFPRPTRGGSRKGSRTVQATPPPRPKPAKGRGEGRKLAPIAPEAAPAEAPPAAPERTLVELAQVVDQLSTRRKAMLAQLDALETELRAAIDGCAAVLDAERLEAA